MAGVSGAEPGTRPATVGRRALAGLLLLALLLAGVADISTWSQRLATPTLDLIAPHWRQIRETRVALADFQQRLSDDDILAAQPLPGLDGRNVTLAFIESYGVSAIFDARYAPLIRSRLARMHKRLRDAGLYIAMGRLTSPAQGGQSWLTHATLLSGLWLPSQRHYELMLAQYYPTLIDDFQATGHHALAVMAVIDDWSALDDGEIFARWEDSGIAPEEL